MLADSPVRSLGTTIAVSSFALTLALAAGSCSSSGTGELQPATAAPVAERIDVRPQRGWEDAVLYFVIVDRFADGDPDNNQDVVPDAQGAFHGGDLAGLIAQLDEISDLGATALWITPVVEQIPGFVTGAGFPDWAYHGYWANDFEKVDRRFGTETELKQLADECHARGMKLLLDVVYNHCGYDADYVRFPGRPWVRFGSECGDDDLTMCLSGLPDFKTRNPQVRDYLLDAHLDRAAAAGLDGFRLDTVKHVEHDFWDVHRRRSRAELGEDFFLIGEVWGGDAQNLEPWFEPDEMDAGFDFSFQGSVLGFLLGRGRPVAFDHYLQRREKVREGHLVSHYLSSHDTEGAIHTLNGDLELFRLAAVLQLTARGIPCIFYGEEVGRRIGEWPLNRTDMPWGDRAVEPGAGVPRNEELRAFYRTLIRLRREHPSIWRGEREGLDFGTDHLVFVRRDPASGDAILVAINRGDQPAAAAVSAPTEWPDLPVVNYLTGEEIPVTVGTVKLSLPPRSALVAGPGPRP